MLKHRQSGMSLIEAMVAVAILGAGLLGLAAMQGRALAMAQSAQYRSVAADLAANLGERIRANRSPFVVKNAGAVHADLASSLPPNFALCTQDSDPETVTCTTQPGGHKAYRVSNEMNEWNDSLRSQLTNGTFTLTSSFVDGWRYRYTLTITWADNRKSGTGSSENFSYKTVIE